MVDQAIILAAGKGLRLRPLTDDKPKCLVEVGGRPLLARHLSMLDQARIPSITIVTGHMKGLIEDFVARYFPGLGVRFRNNEHFGRTNTGYSLGVALSERPASFILIDGDLFFEAAVLQCLIDSPHENVLAVDDISPLNEEAMKVRLCGEKQRVTGASKKWPVDQAAGEYIGLAKFNVAWAQGLVSWWRQTPLEDHALLYYEDGINSLVDTLPPIAPMSTLGLACVEIDTLEDLRRAQRLATSPGFQRLS